MAELEVLKGLLEEISTWKKGVIPASSVHNLQAYLEYFAFQQTKAPRENIPMIPFSPSVSLSPSLSLYWTTACCFSFHFKRFKPFNSHLLTIKMFSSLSFQCHKRVFFLRYFCFATVPVICCSSSKQSLWGFPILELFKQHSQSVQTLSIGSNPDPTKTDYLLCFVYFSTTVSIFNEPVTTMTQRECTQHESPWVRSWIHDF